MRGQPVSGGFAAHRQGHLKFPAAPPVSSGKNGRAEEGTYPPENAPHRDRCRQSGVGGERGGSLPGDRDQRQRGGDRSGRGRGGRSLSRQQGINAEAGRQGKGNQQAGEDGTPEDEKGPLGDAVKGDSPEKGNDRDHHAALNAHGK